LYHPTLLEILNWTHEQRKEKQKCFCGKFANYGKPITNSIARELLCTEHYREKERPCHITKEKKQNLKVENQLNLL